MFYPIVVSLVISFLEFRLLDCLVKQLVGDVFATIISIFFALQPLIWWRIMIPERNIISIFRNLIAIVNRLHCNASYWQKRCRTSCSGFWLMYLMPQKTTPEFHSLPFCKFFLGSPLGSPKSYVGVFKTLNNWSLGHFPQWCNQQFKPIKVGGLTRLWNLSLLPNHVRLIYLKTTSQYQFLNSLRSIKSYGTQLFKNMKNISKVYWFIAIS